MGGDDQAPVDSVTHSMTAASFAGPCGEHPGNNLRPRVKPEFAQDAFDMDLDRSFANHQFGRNCAVGQSTRDEFGNLLLARGQR